MDPRRVDGLLDVHIVVDDVCNHTQHSIDNSWTTWTTNREPETTVLTQNYGWCHGGQWTFAWGDSVALTLDETVHIRRAWFGREVVHFVVENDSSTACDCCRTVGVVERVSIRHRVS